MNAFFESIKVFIEKVNLIICLLAIALTILVYQLVIKESLWAIFTFCISYVLFAGIYSLYVDFKEKLRQENEDRRLQEDKISRMQQAEARKQLEKSQTEARLRTIYASLPDEVKKGLELFYNLPKEDGGFRNTRILRKENIADFQVISHAITLIRLNFAFEDLIDTQSCFNSQIIKIMPEFYDIIEEMANKK